ncbi:MAG TPA: cytochrome c-type biogenesis protein [Devosiaceae bacterium]|nr:cytochrome c-type biogenesis protein [Devosiaceae bacterium]
MIRAALLALLLAVATPGAARAVEPDEMLADPALEARARDISAGLRCLVCQNQSIDDSNADLARDLRILVRERLTAGDTDAEAVDYIVARYGEFVLLQPVFGARTLALWLMAPVLFGGGALLIIIGVRRRRAAAPAALSAEERAEIDHLLENRDPGSG